MFRTLAGFLVAGLDREKQAIFFVHSNVFMLVFSNHLHGFHINSKIVLIMCVGNLDSSLFQYQDLLDPASAGLSLRPLSVDD